jgi:hypothetical protein
VCSPLIAAIATLVLNSAVCCLRPRSHKAHGISFGRRRHFQTGISTLCGRPILGKYFGHRQLHYTIHRFRDEEVKELLGIPADIETAALIPLGILKLGRRWNAPQRSHYLFAKLHCTLNVWVSG